MHEFVMTRPPDRDLCAAGARRVGRCADGQAALCAGAMLALCELAPAVLVLRVPAACALAVCARARFACACCVCPCCACLCCAPSCWACACAAVISIVRTSLVNVIDITGFVVDMCVLVVLEPMPAARANAVRLRAGRVVRLCSVRLDRAAFVTSPTSRGCTGLCFVRALCMCALARPMPALRVPAVRALAAHACVVRACAPHARVACTCCACPRCACPRCACPRCALSCWVRGVVCLCSTHRKRACAFDHPRDAQGSCRSPVQARQVTRGTRVTRDINFISSRFGRDSIQYRVGKTHCQGHQDPSK